MPLDLTGTITHQMAQSVIAEWNALELKTCIPLPMDHCKLRAIVSGDCNAIPLLRVKPEERDFLMGLNKGRPNNRYYTISYDHPIAPLLTDINTSTAHLFERGYNRSIEVDVYNNTEPRTSTLHADRNRADIKQNFHGWNLVGRLGAYAAYSASHSALNEADRYVVENATGSRIGPITARQAILKLRRQKVLERMELDTLYLIRVKFPPAHPEELQPPDTPPFSTENGNIHVSPPHRRVEESCFIRADVLIKCQSASDFNFN